jgi:hypothetical protein
MNMKTGDQRTIVAIQHTMNNQLKNFTGFEIESVSLGEIKSRRNLDAPIAPIGIVPFIEQALFEPSSAVVGEDFFSSPNSGTTDTRVVYHGGAIASGLPIVLIYWGPEWSTRSNNLLLQQFDAAARSLVAGPFPSALEQYGVARPWVKESIQVTSPGPPARFNDNSVYNLVFSLIDSGRYPEPDEDGGRNFYCVVMPPGTTYGPGGLSGAHSFPSGGSSIDTDTTWVAWVGADILDTMTRTFGHELVETCTDPEGDGWYVDSLGAGGGEIGDLCNSRQGFVNGVWAEYYWSNAANACILPTTVQIFAQQSQIAALTRNPDQMDIFGVDSTGGVSSAWWHGDWHNWFTFPDAAYNQGAPVTALSRNPNQMDLFVLGMDGVIRSIFWNGNWSGWFEIPGAGFNQGNSITALSRNPNQMDLFVLGTDGVIRSIFWNGNWSGWFEIPGAGFNQGNSITALSRNPNQMDLFVLGTDGVIRSIFWHGGWSEWFEITGAGFNQGTPITALSRNPNQMDLFAVGEDGVVRSIFWNGNWSGWFEIPGAAFNQGTPITAISRNPNQMDLFAVGLDGGVYSTWWNGNWNGWFRVA